MFVGVEEDGIADLSIGGTQCNLVVDGGQSTVTLWEAVQPSIFTEAVSSRCLFLIRSYICSIV